jgi:hypothetical protein
MLGVFKLRKDLTAVLTRFRASIAGLIAWFFVLFNVERLYSPLNIASVVYVVAAAAMLLVVLWPALATLRISLLLLLCAIALVAAKAWLGFPLGRMHLPITLTEYAAIVVSVLLARQIVLGINEFQAATLRNMVSHLVDRSQPFVDGQADIYREVRRARVHKRPLSLLVIEAQQQADPEVLDRFTTEAIRNMANRYITSRLADFLSRGLKDCDLIAERNGGFVVLLPETRAAKARSVCRRLQEEARAQLDLELRIGQCTLPDEEVTLVGLLERAQANLAPPRTPKEVKSHAPHNGHAHALLAETSGDTLVDGASYPTASMVTNGKDEVAGIGKPR